MTRSRNPVRDPSARTRALVSILVGVAVGAALSSHVPWRYSLLLGWMTTGAVFVAWMWSTIGPMDAPQTQRHACREDPGQKTSDLIVVGAAIASLAAVGLFISGSSSGGGSGGGSSKDLVALLSVCSVALAWASVHTVYTARYARMYYVDSRGGIDFNHDAPPRYADFAYLAFTVGMTFQVSDTDISRQDLRAVILRHMLLSYLLGAVVVATTINLVAGLAQ